LSSELQYIFIDFTLSSTLANYLARIFLEFQEMHEKGRRGAERNALEIWATMKHIMAQL
jgi:predicted nuclease of predicted toxin-antitoxin system